MKLLIVYNWDIIHFHDCPVCQVQRILISVYMDAFLLKFINSVSIYLYFLIVIFFSYPQIKASCENRQCLDVILIALPWYTSIYQSWNTSLTPKLVIINYQRRGTFDWLYDKKSKNSRSGLVIFQANFLPCHFTMYDVSVKEIKTCKKTITVFCIGQV